MQLDLPPRRSWPFLRDPVLRDPGVVIARGVEKNMDQRRAAFGNGAGLLLDESAGLTKTFNALSCAARKSPRCRPCRSWSGLQSRGARRVAPVANGAAAGKQRRGGGPAAPSAVQQHTCVGPPRHPMRRRSIPRQLHPAPTSSSANPSSANAISFARSSSPRKWPPVIPLSGSVQPQNARKFTRILNQPGDSCKFLFFRIF